MDPIVRTVANLMRLRGGLMPMVVTTPGVYNPETSSVDTRVRSYTVRALVLDAKESLTSGLVKTGDKQVFILPDQDIPAPDQTGTEIIYKGYTLKVYLVKEMNPSGDYPLYYEVYARR